MFQKTTAFYIVPTSLQQSYNVLFINWLTGWGAGGGGGMVALRRASSKHSGKYQGFLWETKDAKWSLQQEQRRRKGARLGIPWWFMGATPDGRSVRFAARELGLGRQFRLFCERTNTNSVHDVDTLAHPCSHVLCSSSVMLRSLRIPQDAAYGNEVRTRKLDFPCLINSNEIFQQLWLRRDRAITFLAIQ